MFPRRHMHSLECCHYVFLNENGIVTKLFQKEKIMWISCCISNFYACGTKFWGYLVIVLSMAKKKNYNLGNNVWTVRYRDFIFGIHSQLQILSNDTKLDDLEHDLYTKNSCFALCYHRDILASWTLLVLFQQRGKFLNKNENCIITNSKPWN